MMGVPFRRVTVQPNAVFAGHVTLCRKDPPEQVNPWNPDWNVKTARPYWAARICGALAGPLAETLYTGDEPLADENTDECKAFVIATYFHAPAKADRWLNRLRFQTMETLRAPDVWAAVAVVAEKLCECSTLTGAEVRAMLPGAIKKENETHEKRKQIGL